MSLFLSKDDETHDDEAVTVTGLCRVLRSMRWEDLEFVARELETWRKCQGADEEPATSKKPLTARVLSGWADQC